MTYEILSMNELDAVSGGTNGEYKEIRKHLPLEEFYQCEPGAPTKGWRYKSPLEVEIWLSKNLGIEARIYVGEFYDPRSSAGSPNLYMRDGKRLTHSKVIAEIHNFLGE